MTDKKSDGQEKDPRIVVLSDGREIQLDISACTWGDVMNSGATKGGPAMMSLLSKVTGLSAEEYNKLLLEDGSLLYDRVWQLLNNPVGADPS